MSYSTILIPSDSIGGVSDHRPKVAATVVVALPTTTPDLAIESDPEVEPSEAPPSPDYVHVGYAHVIWIFIRLGIRGPTGATHVYT
ncbi:hypothetical protein Tco_1563423 [Tanacetum coccineum]